MPRPLNSKKGLKYYEEEKNPEQNNAPPFTKNQKPNDDYYSNYQESLEKSLKFQDTDQQFEEQCDNSSNTSEEMDDFDWKVEDWRIIEEEKLSIPKINSEQTEDNFNKIIPDPIKALLEHLIQDKLGEEESKDELSPMVAELANYSGHNESQFEPPFGVTFQNFNFSDSLSDL